MIQIKNDNMTKLVDYPKYGNQDIGITPGGAMDMFAFETAKSILGTTCDTYEFAVMPPRIEVTETITCIVTGAKRQTYINGNPVKHACTFIASDGDIITFGKLEYGFRTYFSLIDGTRVPERCRGEYSDIAPWASKVISVIPGPEYHVLKNPKQFFGQWKVGLHDNMGMRLEGIELEQKDFSMVSGPVANGTVQLTPNGPIILLRNRQTVGGYPRVFNVISTDLDMLAQYYKGQSITFQMAEYQYGETTLKQQSSAIATLGNH